MGAQSAPPIISNNYSVEVFQGPVLGPSRMLGLGGAYAGLAEGVDGVNSNVAAPAVRPPYSSHHVELDVTASAYFPGSYASTDFENRGSVDVNASNFFYGNAGALVQVGPFGAALTADLTSFTVGSGQNTLDFRVVRAHAIVAWAFFDHQLVIGAGVQAATVNLISGLAPLAPPSGLGPEIGALLKLTDQPWRVGVSARYPVWGSVAGQFTTDGNGNKVVVTNDASGMSHTYLVPQNVVFPGQIEAGFALQLGPRPLNPRWRDPVDELAPLRERVEAQRKAREERDAADVASVPEGPAREKRRRELDSTEKAIRRIEDQRIETEEKSIQELSEARYSNLPRARLLVVADAVVTAPVDDAVAISSFLDQKNERFGRSWTISPRVGLEGEPILDRILLRFGSYLEPSLFDFGSARQHFTFGGDLKLLQWDVFGLFPKATWQVSFATDLAPRYTNWGISLGLWR